MARASLVRHRPSLLAPSLTSALLAALSVSACSSPGPTVAPQVRIDSLPPAAPEEPEGNLLASVTVTARPAKLVVDGDLSEWPPFPDPLLLAGPEPVLPRQRTPKPPVPKVPSSRLAVAITPAGLALAGELSPSLAESFWLTIVLDVPELPSIGKWVPPGHHFPLYCSGDMDTDELVECRQLLENRDRLAAEHAARFQGHYHIRPSGVSVHRDGSLTPVEGAQIAFQSAGRGGRVEITIPPRGLPRTQQAPFRTFHAHARGAPASKPPVVSFEESSAFTLPVPAGFEPHAALRESVFAAGQQVSTEKPFSLSYQPGDGLEIEDIVHETSTSLRQEEKILYSKQASMGDVEVGWVHTGTPLRPGVAWTSVISLLRGAPVAITNLEGSAAGAVQRDGEILAFATWSSVTEEPEMRMARWDVVAIGPDGAHRTDVVDAVPETDSIVDARHAHAPDFSTLTITGRKWDSSKGAAGPGIDITWTWDPKAKRYRPKVSTLKEGKAQKR